MSSCLNRGNSPIRNRATLGSYSRIIPRPLWWSPGGGVFLMSEVPLYGIKWPAHPFSFESRKRMGRVQQQSLVSHCRTTSASTAPCTSKRMCCPARCASNYASCQPLL